MRVLVMQVWEMRMPVHQLGVPVNVHVRLPGRIVRSVRVLMVLVMYVGMLVHHLFVRMLVLVTFCQVQPESGAHEQGGRE